MLRQECMEKLEQYILDEDRIMTYKILSHELKIHVNIAKQYLSEFLKIQESKSINLLASFFLAGFTEIDGYKTTRVLVVTEKNLEKEKKKFSEITSCHIYSLSKCSVDECSLLLAERCCTDRFLENCKYTSIKHNNVETKPVVLKPISIPKDEPRNSLPKKQETASSKSGSSSFFQTKQAETKKNIASGSVKENVPELKSEVVKDTSEKPKPKECAEEPIKPIKSNTLASMWQKKEEKSKNEASKSEAKGKAKSPSKKTKNVPKNNIMSMFSKQAERISENPPKKLPTETSNEINKIEAPKKASEDPLKTSPIENGTKSKGPPKTNSNKRKSTNRQTKKKSSKKSDDESDDEFQPKKKKHRRICVFEDSDSESENEEAQDRAQCSIFSPEDPLQSPEEVKSSPAVASDESEEPIPPTPPVLPGVKSRKKYMKTVQTTYQDEDGFFVTKQEKKLVSESESDEESKPNSKSLSNKDVGKPNIFAYRKQASLTSFFKQS